GERVVPSFVEAMPDEDTNLDDDETALVGRAIPVSLALLGLGFIACMLVVAGLPPLSGFVAKLVLLHALMRVEGLGLASTAATWSLFGLLLLSGLAATVALTRAGIRHFWSDAERPPQRVKAVEGVAVLVLLLACVALAIRAEPVLRYTSATAEALHAPAAYIDAVLSTRPVPTPAPAIGEQGEDP
ncbi:MAG TPA: hypothetical protein VFG69_19655, partial [Nannocystaceae bacterium]|nr:hypothetical protein [Nannocystaceae bacterium]